MEEQPATKPVKKLVLKAPVPKTKSKAIKAIESCVSLNIFVLDAAIDFSSAEKRRTPWKSSLLLNL